MYVTEAWLGTMQNKLGTAGTRGVVGAGIGAGVGAGAGALRQWRQNRKTGATGGYKKSMLTGAGIGAGAGAAAGTLSATKKAQDLQTKAREKAIALKKKALDYRENMKIKRLAKQQSNQNAKDMDLYKGAQ
jgi:hypothetical protein